jgi:hypothetical protein
MHQRLILNSTADHVDNKAPAFQVQTQAASQRQSRTPSNDDNLDPSTVPSSCRPARLPTEATPLVRIIDHSSENNDDSARQDLVSRDPGLGLFKAGHGHDNDRRRSWRLDLDVIFDPWRRGKRFAGIRGCFFDVFVDVVRYLTRVPLDMIWEGRELRRRSANSASRTGVLIGRAYHIEKLLVVGRHDDGQQIMYLKKKDCKRLAES